MDSKEFSIIRSKLGKTQKELAQLLGISLKAVCSYEQGWRKIPGHIERQMLLLASTMCERLFDGKPCWEATNCPENRRNRCPAWEFQLGNLCWFISGTLCRGEDRKTWEAKMRICRECNYFISFGKEYQDE